MALNPEHAAIHNLDRERRGDHIKQTAEKLLPLHEKIAATMGKIAIQPTDFEDLYGESIEKDNAYVIEKKEQFAQTEDRPFVHGLTEGHVRQLAEILEYQVLLGINVGNWIPYCRAIKTSEFDDIKHGVDMMLEFQKPELYGHLGMGIDVSFSHNLIKKFQRIKDEIDRYDGKYHRLGTVKYFNSSATGIRGELSSLPRVVLGIDIGVMEDLARTKKDSIGQHIARHEVVHEMEHQLAVFADYARKIKSGCLDHIMRAQNFMHAVSLMLESEKTLSESGYVKNRKVEQAMEDGLSLFR